MSDCLFCHIVDGSEPASIIYEDELAMVILDLFPVSDGHALLIARQHAAQLSGLQPGVSGHLLMLAEKVMAAQKKLDSSIGAPARYSTPTRRQCQDRTNLDNPIYSAL